MVWGLGPLHQRDPPQPLGAGSSPHTSDDRQFQLQIALVLLSRPKHQCRGPTQAQEPLSAPPAQAHVWLSGQPLAIKRTALSKLKEAWWFQTGQDEQPAPLKQGDMSSLPTSPCRGLTNEEEVISQSSLLCSTALDCTASS
ncbi:hypothetical protein SRHO_G00214970 [Serrasalmus rhombeus]